MLQHSPCSDSESSLNRLLGIPYSSAGPSLLQLWVLVLYYWAFPDPICTALGVHHNVVSSNTALELLYSVPCSNTILGLHSKCCLVQPCDMVCLEQAEAELQAADPPPLLIILGQVSIHHGFLYNVFSTLILSSFWD
jgi:hypothetical protein